MINLMYVQRETSPYGNNHLVLRKPLSCSPCFRKKCNTLECMNTLSVEEVLAAALEKLRENNCLGTQIKADYQDKEKINSNQVL